MKKVIILLVILALAVTAVGCGSWGKKESGAVIGASTGAVIGGAIGHQAGNTALGAIIGAVVGGAAGAYIGNYMDKQAEEMERDLEGAKIERVGEGIKITFNSGILFAVNQSTLQSEARANLDKLSTILNKYDDTEILIEGHTDSTGPRDFNMDLSMRRAQSVANELTSHQVMVSRMHIMGYGPDQPVEPNDTYTGRQENRRVDLAIYANDKLKGTAEKKAEG